jgi:hypothetical protein
VSAYHADEYYREPGLGDAEARALLLADTVLPDGLTADEEREACRALKGSLLRQEIYALDATAKAPHPYTITEQNFTIRVLQPQDRNRYAVFLTHAREALSYQYEREPADPRVSHALTLEVDDFGNVLTSAMVGYGRREADLELTLADQAKQTAMLLIYTEQRYTNVVESVDAYRTPLPAEARTFELTGLALSPGAVRFSFDELLAGTATATAIPYEQAPTPGVTEKRLIEHARTFYRRDDLAGPLPLCSLESLALPFDSYRLALTPGLVAGVYGGRVVDAMLADEGRYVHSEGDTNWWEPSGQVFYSPGPDDTAAEELVFAWAHFFLPRRARDPFHTSVVSTESFVSYDRYDLLVEETRDALGNRVTAGERNPDPTLPPVGVSHDYRVLQPAMVMDPNRNRSAVAFDAFGLVAGTAVMGKPEESPVPGDQLTPAFHADLTQSAIDHFFTDPKGPAAAVLLDEASTRIVYDLTAYQRDPAKRSPAATATLIRETHASPPVPTNGLRIQASFSYSDGFAREIQKKAQAEPGPTPRRDTNGEIVVGADGQPEMTAGDTNPRWVASGWTVFNKQGQAGPAVRAVFHRHPPLRVQRADRREPGAVLRPPFPGRGHAAPQPRLGEGPVRPVARRALGRQRHGAPRSGTRRRRGTVAPTTARRGVPTDLARPARRRRARAAEQDAATKTAVHAGTPTLAHADTLGRTFLTVAHNRFERNGALVEERYPTHVVLDIEGNHREVHDANDRLVMHYDYDMLSTTIHHASMDAGERWTLHDIAGTAIRTWDSREHQFRTTYDQLHRPVESYVREGNGPELLVARTVYGETQPDPELANLRGKVALHFDQAGLITSDRYDFKGGCPGSRGT